MKPKKEKVKYARAITEGVIATGPKTFDRTKLLLQHAVDSGGDSILVTLENPGDETIAYIVPTVAMKMLLDEELTE